MRKIVYVVFFLIIATALIMACNNKKTKQAETSKADLCDCTQQSLPHSQTPNTIDGAGGPFDTDSTSNCMFHQLAVQKFLWLTRTMSNGHAYFQDSLLQVDVNLQSMPSSTEFPDIKLYLNDDLQAGSSGKLYANSILAQDGNSHLVYYSKFVNSTLRDACNKYKNELLQNPNLLDSNGYTFPDGALELKVSWIDTNAIPKAEIGNYYITDAVVESKGLESKRRVALLGIHVVAKVYNHPEFIWATFEHHDLAPYYDWKNSTAEKESEITSANKLFFRQAPYSNNDWITYPFAPKAFSVFKYGTPQTNGNAFMLYTSQSKHNGDEINYQNIESINISLTKKLDDVWKNYFYNGAIWLNMDGLDSTAQVERLWKNAHKGFHFIEIDTTSDARGSLACKNITMETYTQVFDTINKLIATANQIGNCFGCHNGFTTTDVWQKDTGFSPLYYSHIFNHYLRYNEKKDKGEALAKKRDNELLLNKIKVLKSK
jgi:hypothetical protein